MEGKGGWHSDHPSTHSSRSIGDEGLACTGVDGDCVIAVGRSLWHSVTRPSGVSGSVPYWSRMDVVALCHGDADPDPDPLE